MKMDWDINKKQAWNVLVGEHHSALRPNRQVPFLPLTYVAILINHFMCLDLGFLICTCRTMKQAHGFKLRALEVPWDDGLEETVEIEEGRQGVGAPALLLSEQSHLAQFYVFGFHAAFVGKKNSVT